MCIKAMLRKTNQNLILSQPRGQIVASLRKSCRTEEIQYASSATSGLHEMNHIKPGNAKIKKSAPGSTRMNTKRSNQAQKSPMTLHSSQARECRHCCKPVSETALASKLLRAMMLLMLVRGARLRSEPPFLSPPFLSQEERSRSPKLARLLVALPLTLPLAFQLRAARLRRESKRAPQLPSLEVYQ